MSELHHSNPALPVVKPTTTTKPTTVDDDKGYARSGRIMLGAIVVLFGVIIVMVLLHIYARWYIHRHPTSSNSTTRRRRRRRIADHHHQHHLVFYLDDPASASTAPSSDGANRRLDPSVLKSLPTFTFAPHTASTTTATTTTAGEGKEEEEEKEEEETVMECAVCLSEFEEGEMGRILPRCRHSFHVDCIDMWFHSHSTCPLCRSTVTAADNDDSNQLEIVVVDLSSSSSESIPTLNPADSPPPDATATATNDHTSSTSSSSSSTSAEAASAAASGFCPDPSSTSSFGGRRKGTVGGVSVEIPARSASFSFLNPAGAVTDDSPSTPGSSLGFRSPTSRLVYLRRILLSREKRPAACSPGSGSGCGAELSEMEEGVVGGGRSPRTADICTGTTVPAPESS